MSLGAYRSLGACRSLCAAPARVAATFRSSMRELSATMLRTHQNFVCCVKPNGKKLKEAFSGEFTGALRRT